MTMKTIEHKITGINFNWFSTPENGEEFSTRSVGDTIGDLKIDFIKEHPACGEGDKWYYDVMYSNGKIERIFNPNSVFFSQV